jgi:hypothetical protein
VVVNEIPTLVRNQSLRIGSKIAGKAVSSTGTLLISHGIANSKRTPRANRYESVTKKSVRAKGGSLQKNTVYLSSNSRRANRQIHRTRYNRPGPRGQASIKSGIALRGVGRALPLLAVGYIGYDLARGETPAATSTPDYIWFGQSDVEGVASAGQSTYGRFQQNNSMAGRLVKTAAITGITWSLGLLA